MAFTAALRLSYRNIVLEVMAVAAKNAALLLAQKEKASSTASRDEGHDRSGKGEL